MRRDEALLKVIEDVYEGGKDLIPNWQLLNHAKKSLENGGSEGLKKYYENCLNSGGKKVKETLERNGRKTLESEYQCFMEIYSSNGDTPSQLPERRAHHQAPARGELGLLWFESYSNDPTVVMSGTVQCPSCQRLINRLYRK
jgi:hypothetical protein